MINVAAIRMQQFGVQFYQASLTASDIDKLVRFEVLNYGDAGQSGVRGGRKRAPSKVNWDLLERRIASNERAYQRQIIRRAGHGADLVEARRIGDDAIARHATVGGLQAGDPAQRGGLPDRRR